MMTKIKYLLLGVALGIVVNFPVNSQSAGQEVAPYKIADVPNDGVYKLVHHGCAVYFMREHIFQMNHGDATAVAIATGEGCH